MRDTPHTPLRPLPSPSKSDGTPRKVGVEIEVAGLSEADIAAYVVSHMGGDVVEVGLNAYEVRSTTIGTVEVYLDTALRKGKSGQIAQHGLDLARRVIPVELVTAPLTLSEFEELDSLVPVLRAAGAEGSREHVLFGFGVHFNPEIVSDALADILPVFTAFALLEGHLRATWPLDPSRRALPFVDPYPRSLIDALVESPPTDIDVLTTLYLDHAPSRNHGLDLLCLLKHLRPKMVEEALPNASVSARPTYHLRLPECRINEADWSLSTEWEMWRLVESVAADAACLDELKEALTSHRGALTTTRLDWPPTVTALLSERGYKSEGHP